MPTASKSCWISFTLFFAKMAFEPPSSSSGKSGNFCATFLNAAAMHIRWDRRRMCSPAFDEPLSYLILQTFLHVRPFGLLDFLSCGYQGLLIVDFVFLLSFSSFVLVGFDVGEQPFQWILVKRRHRLKTSWMVERAAERRAFTIPRNMYSSSRNFFASRCST